ncbi:uncharacterized protein LOC111519165 isoform X2 [Drosophila willistoni]|uniref:uncharacterized protein LOC111519165 isoform X2 n=1 Tax=Drosophila willistoni TaxID=7260 RepID=UPI000C26CA28|nr:uncharacterized protein LOC111519165 isoform X2 [Drosophila willistoni]
MFRYLNRRLINTDKVETNVFQMSNEVCTTIDDFKEAANFDTEYLRPINSFLDICCVMSFFIGFVITSIYYLTPNLLERFKKTTEFFSRRYKMVDRMNESKKNFQALLKKLHIAKEDSKSESSEGSILKPDISIDSEMQLINVNQSSRLVCSHESRMLCTSKWAKNELAKPLAKRSRRCLCL